MAFVPEGGLIVLSLWDKNHSHAGGPDNPPEGGGWDLFAIASVVVGGTLLTGGLIFNLLDFENVLG